MFKPVRSSSMYYLRADRLDTLFDALKGQGFEVFGPTVRDGAIVYDRVQSAAELPVGVGDEQSPGHYRLTERGDGAFFGFVVGPHSWKKYLFPPRTTLWDARRTPDGFSVSEPQRPSVKRAFLGVRACELAALGIQDRVFLGGEFVDRDYAARRADVFLIAVNCTDPAGTCFCTSMGTGPAAHEGYDLSLTEVYGEGHSFLVDAGTDAGRALARELELREAAVDEVARGEAALDNSRSRIKRSLQTDGLREGLQENLEHPRYKQTAARCLACGNCTMVCPTCFCSSVEDITDLAGETSTRERRWASCFTHEHSYTAGGTARTSHRSMYRQWLTHKLSTWWDQFDSSGCVGCGRCITWCPVGIDITEEAQEIAHGSRVV